jgi:hypothetical protein
MRLIFNIKQKLKPSSAAELSLVSSRNLHAGKIPVVNSLMQAVSDHFSAKLRVFRRFAREKSIDRLAENLDPAAKML